MNAPNEASSSLYCTGVQEPGKERQRPEDGFVSGEATDPGVARRAGSPAVLALLAAVRDNHSHQDRIRTGGYWGDTPTTNEQLYAHHAESVRPHPQTTHRRRPARRVGRQAGPGAAESVFHLLAQRFTDHSQALLKALHRSNEQAWKALEIALAGDSLWDKCKLVFTSADDKSFREQLRPFLDACPLAELNGKAAFRADCLRNCVPLPKPTC